MRARKLRVSFSIGLFSTLAVFSAAANANVQEFSASGTSQDGSVSATADFTVSANSIMIRLFNTLMPVTAATLNGLSQLLSEISFSVAGTPVLPFSGAPTGGNAGIGTDAGGLATVSSGGTVNTSPAGTGIAWTYGVNSATSPPGFAVPLGQPSPTGFLLSALVGSPRSLISPTLTSGNTFCSSGCDGITNSIDQPYYNGSATFTLTFASGVAADAAISNVRFGFGTAPTAGGGEPDLPAVPIPAAVWLFGSGLLGLIGIARRRQSGNATSPSAVA